MNRVSGGIRGQFGLAKGAGMIPNFMLTEVTNAVTNGEKA